MAIGPVWASRVHCRPHSTYLQSIIILLCLRVMSFPALIKTCDAPPLMLLLQYGKHSICLAPHVHAYLTGDTTGQAGLVDKYLPHVCSSFMGAASSFAGVKRRSVCPGLCIPLQHTGSLLQGGGTRAGAWGGWCG
jgi:hypothetical protein